ncbi:MAG: hypothetical protein K0U12_01835 [Gammaproteobacteria bacterium]|nr:hypothetical protein [Gammaproteobacteria bacterium]
MSVNIFWVLLTVVLTYFFSKDIEMSALSGVIVLIIFGYLGTFSSVFSYLKNRDKEITLKLIAEKLMILLFLLTLTLALYFYFSPITKADLSLRKLDKAYQVMSTSDVLHAIKTLKAHPNDIRYCALIMFPSLKDNKSSSISRYLAYYYLEDKYCSDFWQFGDKNCVYLKNLNYNGHSVELMKNIRLCEIAKSGSFKLRLLEVEQRNG